MVDKDRLPRGWWRAVRAYSPHVFLSLALICFLLRPQASLCGPPAAPSITGIAPTSGPVGTLVTITGSHFNNTNAVHFGSVSAAFTFISSTEVTATVPVGFSGSVNVTVTALFAGTSATNANDLFTLSVPPAFSTPALSQWSMIALGLLLACFGGFALRRKFA